MTRAQTRTRSTTVSIPWIVGILVMAIASWVILLPALYLADLGFLTTLQIVAQVFQ